MGVRVKAVMRGIGNGARSVGRGLKSVTMRWSGQLAGWSSLWLPRSNFNYAREIGDGSRSNIVQAVVGWIARTFPEAPLLIVDEQTDGTQERVVGHRLPKLLERPNTHYSGVLLWMATLTDWSLSGNAYWIKRRVTNAGPLRDAVMELWWAPAWTMEPRWSDDGSDFISHYEYRPNAEYEPVKYAPEDIVHFRYGIDAQNTRKGCSPLRSLMREIFTDEEASNFTASLMKNLGVPGVVLSPDASVGSISREAAEETKTLYMEKFGGDKRGEPMVQTAPTKVQVLSFSPDQMNLRDLRRVPEERVSAIYGVAAVVVGLGAGLDRATFSNFAEAREAAYEGNIIPTQRLMAADLTLQLLPDFNLNETMSVQFDLTKVRVLQPDMDKVATRMSQAVRDGWAMVAEAKTALALPVADNDYVYLRSLNIEEVRPDLSRVNGRPPTNVVPTAPAKSNGHSKEPIVA